MTAQPLFYKNVVPLNKERHKNLYLEPVEGYKFAAETNSLYIAAVEFIKAAAEYAIVFGKDTDNSVYPFVLLGLKANQNLYVKKKATGRQNIYPPMPVAIRLYLLHLTLQAARSLFVLMKALPGLIQPSKGSCCLTKKGRKQLY